MRFVKHVIPLVPILIAVHLAACDSRRAEAAAAAPEDVDLAEIEAIARDAYVFGFPIVMSYRTLIFGKVRKVLREEYHGYSTLLKY